MFLVDANVLIEAKNRYYAFDIAPGFWQWLERIHREGRVCSIEAVYEEVVRGDDELAEWSRRHRELFRPIDQHTTRFFQPLSTWAAEQDFKPSALNEFTADAADYLLVAFGAAYRCTVVTHERPAPDSRKKIKIPDACAALGVKWDNPWNMLRSTGATLHLAT